MYIIDRFLDEFSYAPPIIKIALVSIILAVLFTITAYLSILYGRYKGFVRDKKLSRAIPVIDQLILENVLMNEELASDMAVEQIQINTEGFAPILNSRWGRQATIDRIINFRKNLRGKTGDLLRQLYLQLELEKESFRKMKSRKWYRKVQALSEFANLDIPIADVSILPLTNSRNRELRAAARHAYIKLSKNEPFKFFDVVTEPLLQWDQIELFRIITTTENISIPNFAKWITYSPNKSIVSFCLKLVVHFNQLAAVPAVVKLLETKDHYLRANAINCLGKLRVEEVEEKLVKIYSSQPLDCQIEILKALGRINTGNYTDFLKNEFLHSTDFDIRKHAARSLVKNQQRSKALIEELINTSTPENKLILKHSMNPLIKY